MFGTLKAIRENRLTATDHDTGIIAAATSGYLRMVGSGENTALDGQTERLAIASMVKVARVEARLAAGSRTMTFTLYVDGGAAWSSASASVGTTWTTFTIRRSQVVSAASRVAIQYTGLMAGDRLFTRVVWVG